MIFEVVIPDLDEVAVDSRWKLMDAQLDRQRAKLRKLATHMITIRDTIDRLARDIQRAVDSKCGSEVFKTLSRQADCMQHRLEEQADKQTTGQKKLVNLLHAKQDFCDWSTDLGVKISTIYKMTGRVFDHYDRASKIMALLTGAADLERQQQGSTSSSASTRLDHFNKLASELVLAVGDIEGFKKAETSFRQLLESVLGSDEGEGQKEDESRDDWSIFALRYVHIELPKLDMDDEVEAEEDVGGE